MASNNPSLSFGLGEKSAAEILLDSEVKWRDSRALAVDSRKFSIPRPLSLRRELLIAESGKVKVEADAEAIDEVDGAQKVKVEADAEAIDEVDGAQKIKVEENSEATDEADGADVTGILGFWLKNLKNVPSLADMIQNNIQKVKVEENAEATDEADGADEWEKQIEEELQEYNIVAEGTEDPDWENEIEQMLNDKVSSKFLRKKTAEDLKGYIADIDKAKKKMISLETEFKNFDDENVEISEVSKKFDNDVLEIFKQGMDLLEKKTKAIMNIKKTRKDKI